jgi:hypothetical protein
MKKWIILSLFTSILCATDMHQKMILSTSLNPSEMKHDLKEVKYFFNHTSHAKKLQEEYGFTFQLETLDKYTLLTLKPIKSYIVKNKINYLLKQKFPESFIVDNTPLPVIKEEKKSNSIPYKSNRQLSTSVSLDKVEKKEIMQVFWKNVSLEWIALIILAIAGLLLVYRSAKQISKIRGLQKKVEDYQYKVEKEISEMGDKDE